MRSLRRSGSQFERGTSEASGMPSEASKAQSDASCAFQGAASERAIQCGRPRPTCSARYGAALLCSFTARCSLAMLVVPLCSHSLRSTYL